MKIYKYISLIPCPTKQEVFLRKGDIVILLNKVLSFTGPIVTYSIKHGTTITITNPLNFQEIEV